MSIKKPILIIEDENDIREPICELLELEGYEVRSASNGQEGLKLLEKIEPPGLIFLDLMMPVMTGWEFLKTIRSSQASALSTIPVVVISAAGEGFNTGDLPHTEFIRKPMEADALLGTAKRYCA